jgi:hypothetical protein
MIHRGDTPEQKVNGDGLHAFYELRGLRSNSPLLFLNFLDFRVKRNTKDNLTAPVSILSNPLIHNFQDSEVGMDHSIINQKDIMKQVSFFTEEVGKTTSITVCSSRTHLAATQFRSWYTILARLFQSAVFRSL